MTADKPPQTQIDPEVFLKRYRDIGDRLRVVWKAKDSWRAEIHAAGSTGINIKALKWVEKLRKMEPREAQSQVRDMILYMRWLGLNILDQEEILADGPSTAGLTSYVMSTHVAWEAGQAGYLAGKEGKPVDDNPFAPGTETHQRWASEWLDGHADAESVAPPGAKEIKPRDNEEGNPEDGEDRLL